mgnify:FL=1
MDISLQQLNRDIIHRKANGKTIWQPRICAWYDDRIFRGEEMPGKFKGCSKKQLYEKIGCSDRIYNFFACLESKYDDSVKYEGKELDELTSAQTLITPIGSVTQVVAKNKDNPGIHPKKWFVETEEDLKVFMYLEEATTYSLNMETYTRIYEDVGHLGLPCIHVPRVNIQKLFLEVAGVENGIYLLMDCPDTVEEYFKILGKSHEQVYKLYCESPFEWLNYGDNLHCKITPPDLFKKYVIPEYEKRYDYFHKAGKWVFSHWDGDVADYLPFARSCFLDGIEAITPEPQGDVTLAGVKKALGDDVFLIDGVAALLFNGTYPDEMLKAQVTELLNLFEGQLVLGISDELPSDGLLNRVELVNDMVNEFNARH